MKRAARRPRFFRHIQLLLPGYRTMMPPTLGICPDTNAARSGSDIFSAKNFYQKYEKQGVVNMEYDLGGRNDVFLKSRL